MKKKIFEFLGSPMSRGIPGKFLAFFVIFNFINGNLTNFNFSTFYECIYKLWIEKNRSYKFFCCRKILNLKIRVKNIPTFLILFFNFPKSKFFIIFYEYVKFKNTYFWCLSKLEKIIFKMGFKSIYFLRRFFGAKIGQIWNF